MKNVLDKANLGRFYWVDFTGYPANHFLGCRINGECPTPFSFSARNPITDLISF